MQPLFHRSALLSYAPIMSGEAGRTAVALAPAAESGEAVELHSALGAMTMRIIGEAAFGWVGGRAGRAERAEAALVG